MFIAIYDQLPVIWSSMRS